MPRSAFWIIAAIHVALVCCIYAPRDMASPEPFLDYDYSMHFKNSLNGSRFLRSGLRTWGYDPDHMAGYVKTPNMTSSIRAVEFFMAAVPIAPPLAFKLAFFLMAASFPFLMLLGLAGWGERSAAALGLGVAIWWVSLPLFLMIGGLLHFAFAVALAFAASGWGRRYLARGGRRAWLIFAAAGAAALFVHYMAFMVLGLFMVFELALAVRRAGLKRTAAAAAGMLVMVAANLPWIISFIRFLPLVDFSRIPDLEQGARFTFLFIGDSPLLLVLLFYAAVGMRGWGREKWAVIATAAVLVVVGYALIFSPRFNLPNMIFRYKFPLYLWLAAPAAMGVRMLGRGRARLLFPAALAAAVMLSIPLSPVWHRIKNNEKIGVNAIMPEYARELIDWIESNTDPERRILIEDSGAFDRTEPEYKYWRAHLPALLPYYTGRSYVGGPWPFYQIVFHWNRFYEGLVFGDKRLIEMPVDEFMRYAELYNIGWVVAWSWDSRGFLDRHPDRIRRLTQIDRFHIYELDRPGNSFFLRGTGRIQAEPDLVRLYEIEPSPQGDIVLSLHYWDRLRADGDIIIDWVPAMDDPVGFIRIADPPPELTIRTGKP